MEMCNVRLEKQLNITKQFNRNTWEIFQIFEFVSKY